MHRNAWFKSLRRRLGFHERLPAKRSDPQPANPYAVAWDQYVKHTKPEAGKWLGDDWGTEEFWELTFKDLFIDQGAKHWRHCVEIGAGSGKYTQYLLTHSAADIVAFDVSVEFLNVLRTRLAGPIAAGRLFPELLLGERPSEMYEVIRQRGWVREVDAFYSIDAMVHVDLQYLMAYVATGALVLKQGGKLMMSLADATTDAGFRLFLEDIKMWYPVQGRPSGKFEWLSRDLIRSVLERIGFEVQFIPELSDRDAYFVATLSDLSHAKLLEAAILD